MNEIIRNLMGNKWLTLKPPSHENVNNGPNVIFGPVSMVGTSVIFESLTQHLWTLTLKLTAFDHVMPSCLFADTSSSPLHVSPQPLPPFPLKPLVTLQA
jgi:hypothetical protein